MNIAIIGSRSFTDSEKFTKELTNILKYIVTPNIIIISGGAVGVDTLAKEWAIKNDFSLVEHLPDYKKHGKSAPHVRNDVIIEQADIIIAFWNGKSKGTGSVINKAKKKGKTVKIIEI